MPPRSRRALQGAAGCPADPWLATAERNCAAPGDPRRAAVTSPKERAAAENLGIDHERRERAAKVTISLGMAVVCPDGMSPQALIHAADEALYRAKRAGRNRAEVATLG
jgi:diguanylate cyclase (GGDEF)-like protein